MYFHRYLEGCESNMLEINKEIIDKMKEVDLALKEKVLFSYNNKAEIRQKIQSKYFPIRQMTTFDARSLSKWLENKEVGAVDGSVNDSKGQAPYILYLFQALAKTMSGKEYRKFDIHCPLLDENVEESEQKLIRTKQMSRLELIVAKQLVENVPLKILLMDGSLTHYQIEAQQEWEELKETALAKDVLLVGVSEAVGTKQLIKADPDWQQAYRLDRDLLFGVLEQGEMLIGVEGKGDVHNTWLRPSTSPAIIGVDVLNEQKAFIEEICHFVYTMTPKSGRGIPLFLDIVDKDVRITDEFVEVLVEQYIAPELKQRFFIPKRSERIY